MDAQSTARFTDGLAMMNLALSSNQINQLGLYIDLLENKLSDKDTDLLILQNQINYLVRRNRQKKKY